MCKFCSRLQELLELERAIARLHVEEQRQRVGQHLAVDPVGQVHQVLGPDAPELISVHELTEDRVDQTTHDAARPFLTPSRRGIALGVGSWRRHQMLGVCCQPRR